MGKVPTISIDKSDGCQIYLSKDSTDAEIVTAKSSEMNILVPDASGEYVGTVYQHRYIQFLSIDLFSIST